MPLVQWNVWLRGEMIFENLRVQRIAIHEIFKREMDRAIRPPVLADRLETLSPEAFGAFRLRMTDALSGQAQSLELRIVKHGPGTLLNLAESLIGSDDAAFLTGTQAIATRLAEEQKSIRIPGGMVVVFDGTAGAPAVPFVGVIKAETQAGFRRSRDGERAIVEFLQNIFLTPATRLYKIGIITFNNIAEPAPKGRKTVVFDSNISTSHRETAAVYFYDGFLGCALPSDGPYETARFFDLTKEYIKKSALDAEHKRDLMDSLYVFVKDEQDAMFTVDQFNGRFMPADMRDSYTDFMRRRNFTPNAVVRDTSEMGTRLRRRKLKFGSDIELTASPEALADRITVEAIDGIAAEGPPPAWTRITIKAALTGEQ